MRHEVKVTILDRGYLVESDEGRTDTCQDGGELCNCLSRIKEAVQVSE